MAGKSVSTMRAWIRSGKLGDGRVKGDKASPIRVSENELRTLLSTDISVKRTESPSVERSTGAGIIAGYQPTVATQGEVDTLRDLVSELRRDKRNLESDVARLREQLEDCRGKVASLERELFRGARGVRGFISGTIDRIRRK